MAIKIEGREYNVNPDQIAFEIVKSELTKLYEKAGDLQFLLMPIARAALSRMEKEAKKKDQDYTVYRPAKKQDPVEFLIDMIAKFLWAFFSYGGDIELITTEDHTISGVEIKGQAWGPLAPDGNIRERENDSVKIS